MTDDLAPGVAPLIAHLHGRTAQDLLAGGAADPAPPPRPVHGVVAADVALPGDPPVAARRYEPTGGAGSGTGIVWVHGGAWVFGTLDDAEADAVARRLCDALDAVVVSVDYRLAPRHRHPAALDDVVASFEALVTDDAVEPTRTVLGGASAGGHLAAAASQVLRDRGGPAPAAVFLAYPATNPPGGPYPADRPDVVPDLLWLDRAKTNLLFGVYADGRPEAPYLLPAGGTLTGLPPTLVTTSTLDALEPQALRYVELLRRAGIEVEHHPCTGLLHGYLSMVGVVDAADDALARHVAWIATTLDR
ncbi:MAG: alpha/beta hydrolase [Actinobacteria bacterium]|nr:alpha/beta hydrolase [Actinomycetota bacterium]